MKSKKLSTLFIAGAFGICPAFVTAEDTPSPRRDDINNQEPGGDVSSDRVGETTEAGDNAIPAADRTAAEGRAHNAAEAGSKMMDQKFVEKAYMMNLAEIEHGNLAIEKASRDEVKEFARMMVDDHKKANKQLKQIAKSNQMQVKEDIGPVHQAMQQELSKLEGDEFDRAYVYGQVAGHHKTVLKFRDASREAQNEQVREFATTMLPALQQHLDHVTQLANWGDEAQPASAREPAARRDESSTDRPTPTRTNAPSTSEDAVDGPAGINSNQGDADATAGEQPASSGGGNATPEADRTAPDKD